MTAENFCYWLQGWLELNKTIDHRDGASKETIQVIEEHLGFVFKKQIVVKELEKSSTQKILEALKPTEVSLC